MSTINLQQNGSKRYLLGEFELEAQTRLLIHDGQHVHLANKPFQVLLYLIERRERIVSRAELLERFWAGKDVYDDALRKSVGAIRKALDDHSNRPRFIETGWADGYRYIGPIEEQHAEIVANAAPTEISGIIQTETLSQLQGSVEQRAAVQHTIEQHTVAGHSRTAKIGNETSSPRTLNEFSNALESQDQNSDTAHQTLPLATQDAKLETQNATLETRNLKLETRNSKLETRNSKLEPAFSRRATSLLVACALLIVVGAGLFIHNRRARSSDESKSLVPPASIPSRSIAVLPFKNLTGDAANDYISDGVTENLITSLSRIDGLKVISRGSVFTFKGKEIDPRDVGRELGVATVLEGGVQKSGEMMRVEARLVSVADGSVLWASERYNRDAKEILVVQDEIARGVVSGMQLKLSATGEQQLARRYTGSTEAYQSYLKGRYFWNQRSAENLQKAIGYFEQAIKLDPNYALAYAGLAETYTIMEVNSLVPPKTAEPQAKANAQKALELDNTLAGTYAALGLLDSFSDRNWTEGDRMFQQAIALDPNYATARHWYANTLLARRRFAQAESELKRAQELDPLSQPILNSLGETYYYSKQSDRCLAITQQLQELAPNNGNVSRLRANCYAQKGMTAEAITAARQFADHTLIAQLSGHQTEARRLILEAARSTLGTRSPFAIAYLYARLGDTEAAFAWLRKSDDAHQADLVSINVDPAFDALRSDARFLDLLRRLNLSDSDPL
jgi:TolB-like protein/DNA-binding winged helix-turn-helix (wHTH) protein/cytochrome c-type biogenesis protein CcmH/NrfG